MRKIKLGARVILTDKSYCPSQTYPVWESSHMCIGTIIDNTVPTTLIYSTIVKVRWDNGIVSSLFLDSLTLYNKDKRIDPNSAFVLRKMEGMG